MKQTNHSWLSLLGYFAVLTLASSLVFAAVFAAVTAALASGESSQTADNQQVEPIAPSKSFSGLITDAHCGPRHADSKKSAGDCARMCVRDGSRYIIVDGDKRYELSGDSQELGELAGQRVNLTGALSGDVIQVNSATALAVKPAE